MYYYWNSSCIKFWPCLHLSTIFTKEQEWCSWCKWIKKEASNKILNDILLWMSIPPLEHRPIQLLLCVMDVIAYIQARWFSCIYFGTFGYIISRLKLMSVVISKAPTYTSIALKYSFKEFFSKSNNCFSIFVHYCNMWTFANRWFALCP